MFRVFRLFLLNTDRHSLNLLQIPQLTESFQVRLLNVTTGEAQLGTFTEALLIVKNLNFALYFNGHYSFLVFLLDQIC